MKMINIRLLCCCMWTNKHCAKRSWKFEQDQLFLGNYTLSTSPVINRQIINIHITLINNNNHNYYIISIKHRQQTTLQSNIHKIIVSTYTQDADKTPLGNAHIFKILGPSRQPNSSHHCPWICTLAYLTLRQL